MLSPDVENEIIESHDELVKVCKAAFAVLIENNLLEQLDAYLFSSNVPSGFAERAEEARRKTMRERVIGIC